MSDDVLPITVGRRSSRLTPTLAPSRSSNERTPPITVQALMALSLSSNLGIIVHLRHELPLVVLVRVLAFLRRLEATEHTTFASNYNRRRWMIELPS